MGRPVKIHKKKSFMFTTKHHPFLGFLALGIGIIVVVAVSLSIMSAYKAAGEAPINYGGVGLFSLLLSFLGVISGMLGLNERDSYRLTSIAGIVINASVIVMWIFLLIIS